MCMVNLHHSYVIRSSSSKETNRPMQNDKLFRISAAHPDISDSDHDISTAYQVRVLRRHMHSSSELINMKAIPKFKKVKHKLNFLHPANDIDLYSCCKVIVMMIIRIFSYKF